ncbi:hypothetical protein JCM8202_000220 [Rhodotorula sphaerocarpa]
MDRPTTRVNGAVLATCSKGQTVRLIGKVINLDDDRALVEASDGVQVTGAAGESAWANSFVEVLGKMMDTTVINELTSQNLGENLDLKLADRVVDLAQRYPAVFPAAT